MIFMSKLFFLIFFLFLFCSNTFANYLATGQAFIFQNQVQKARKQALKNAKENILNQAIQNNFSQNIIDKNWKSLQQEVFAQPNKYLGHIRIISEKKKEDVYFFQINTEVLIEKIQNYLQHQGAQNKNKIFLLYFSNENSYSISDSEVRWFFKNLQKNTSHFILEQDPFANKIWDERKKFLRNQDLIGRSSSNSGKINKEALFTQSILDNLQQKGYQAVVTIHLEMLASKAQKEFIFQKNVIKLNSLIYDLEAGLVKEKTTNYPFFSNSKTDTVIFQREFNDAIIKVADFFSLFLDDYFGSYFFTWRNKKYEIIFHNFHQPEEDQIENLLKNLVGYKNIITQKNRNSLKFSYRSTLSSKRLYQLLRINLEKINLKTKLQNKNSNLNFHKIQN